MRAAGAPDRWCGAHGPTVAPVRRADQGRSTRSARPPAGKERCGLDRYGRDRPGGGVRGEKRARRSVSEQVSRVLAEGPPPLHGFLQRVLDFVQALRRAGVGATQSEAIDAVRTIPHVELLDRRQLREALAAVTVTSQTHRRAFDDLFELYFPARHAETDDTPDVTDEPADELDPDDYLHELLDRLMEGGDEVIRQMARLAVDQFGRVEGRDGGVSYFQYKVFRAVDIQQLLRDLLSRSPRTRSSSPRCRSGSTATSSRLGCGPSSRRSRPRSAAAPPPSAASTRSPTV
jgi:hypothetical protein